MLVIWSWTNRGQRGRACKTVMPRFHRSRALGFAGRGRHGGFTSPSPRRAGSERRDAEENKDAEFELGRRGETDSTQRRPARQVRYGPCADFGIGWRVGLEEWSCTRTGCPSVSGGCSPRGSPSFGGWPWCQCTTQKCVDLPWPALPSRSCARARWCLPRQSSTHRDVRSRDPPSGRAGARGQPDPTRPYGAD